MKKSRVAALLLGLVVPGFGHVYLGTVRRALLFLALNPLLAIVVAVAMPEASPALMIATLVLVLVVTRVAAAGDVFIVPPEQYRSIGAGAAVGLVFGGLVASQATAMILRAYVMEAFKVPAGSMLPSVLVGDHFFVDKLTYRRRPPQRGEMVVFRYPEHPEQDFVKRVAGIEGDVIEVRDGVLVIGGWQVPRCKVGPWTYAEALDDTTHKGTLYVEFLETSTYYVFLEEASIGDSYQGPYRVKAGETFVLGDNRNNSHDSRMWFGGTGGGVPHENVKGRARLVWLSATPGRAGLDLAELGPPPSPDLAEGVKRCVAERPPSGKTSPPPGRRADP